MPLGKENFWPLGRNDWDFFKGRPWYGSWRLTKGGERCSVCLRIAESLMPTEIKIVNRKGPWFIGTPKRWRSSSPLRNPPMGRGSLFGREVTKEKRPYKPKLWWGYAMKKTKLLTWLMVLIAFSIVCSSLAADYKYVGSAKSNKYHYPTCEWALKIHPDNLLTFKSVKEALDMGYVPCKVCRPPTKD